MTYSPSDLIAAADRLESHYEGHIATGPMLRAGAEAMWRVAELEARLALSKRLRDQYRAALEAERVHSNPARRAALMEKQE